MARCLGISILSCADPSGYIYFPFFLSNFIKNHGLVRRDFHPFHASYPFLVCLFGFFFKSELRTFSKIKKEM